MPDKNKKSFAWMGMRPEAQNALLEQVQRIKDFEQLVEDLPHIQADAGPYIKNMKDDLDKGINLYITINFKDIDETKRKNKFDDIKTSLMQTFEESLNKPSIYDTPELGRSSEFQKKMKQEDQTLSPLWQNIPEATRNELVEMELKLRGINKKHGNMQSVYIELLEMNDKATAEKVNIDLNKTAGESRAVSNGMRAKIYTALKLEGSFFNNNDGYEKTFNNYKLIENLDPEMLNKIESDSNKYSIVHHAILREANKAQGLEPGNGIV